MESEIKKETVSEPVKKSEPTQLEKLKEEYEVLKLQKQIEELKNPKVIEAKKEEGITIKHEDSLNMEDLTLEENHELFKILNSMGFSKNHI